MFQIFVAGEEDAGGHLIFLLLMSGRSKVFGEKKSCAVAETKFNEHKIHLAQLSSQINVIGVLSNADGALIREK